MSLPEETVTRVGISCWRFLGKLSQLLKYPFHPPHLREGTGGLVVARTSISPNLCTPLKTKMTGWKISMFNRSHTSSFMLDFPARHVCFRKGKLTTGEKKHRAISFLVYVPWSKVAILGIVIPPLIGILKRDIYINPYYWVDDHPLLYGNNGS